MKSNLIQFDDHRINQLPPAKQAHVKACSIVGGLADAYNSASFNDRCTLGVATVKLGLVFLLSAVIAPKNLIESPRAALYDDERPRNALETNQAPNTTKQPETSV